MGIRKGEAVLSLYDNDESYTKKLPNVNPDYLPNYGTDTAVSPTYGASIRSACQALNNLTTATITEVDVNTTIDVTNA